MSNTDWQNTIAMDKKHWFGHAGKFGAMPSRQLDSGQYNRAKYASTTKNDFLKNHKYFVC